jgi:4'-phosphopantetheinyl transferase
VASPVATSVHRHPEAGSTSRAEPAPAAWVWRIDLADDSRHEAVAVTHLHDRERRRASVGIGAVRRRRILLRAALRQGLGELLDLPPAAVPLVEDAGHLLLDDDTDLHVSCSASGRVGLVAVVAGCEVGVDVQEHREADARTAAAEGWLAPAEELALRLLPPVVRPLAVTRCWTQKEAVLKGLGVGLHRRPVTVVTPVTETGRIGDWAVRPVPVAPGHVASVAVRTPLDEVGLVVRDMTVGEIR